MRAGEEGFGRGEEGFAEGGTVGGILDDCTVN